MQKNMQKKNGFTLIELSIVLVIIGIMLYASISIGAIQVEAAKLKQTRDKIAKLDHALQLYFETNNALPCPAGGALPFGNANFGIGGTINPSSALGDATCPNAVAAPSGTPTIYIGVVPTRDLDLSDDFMMDGWGNRITYVVSAACVDSDNWSDNDLSSNYKCTNGVTATGSNGNLYYQAGGAIVVSDNSNKVRSPYAVYMVISHGRNGLGGYTNEGARIITAAYSSVYDLDNASRANANGTGGDVYDVSFRDDMIVDYEGASGVNYFDDIVSWKTGPQMWFEKVNN